MDPNIPLAYKPFGIQAVGAKIYVTFYNSSSGGYVDVFDTNGKLLLSLQQGRSASRGESRWPPPASASSAGRCWWVTLAAG